MDFWNVTFRIQDEPFSIPLCLSVWGCWISKHNVIMECIHLIKGLYKKGTGLYGCLWRSGFCRDTEEIPYISNKHGSKDSNSVACSSMQCSDRWTNCTLNIEGLYPELHLQVTPLLNFQRKVFQRCCKNLSKNSDWEPGKQKKLFMGPKFNPETSLWHPEQMSPRHKGFYQDFFTNQSEHFALKLHVEETKNSDKGSTVAIWFCALCTARELVWRTQIVYLRAGSNSVVLP